MEEDATLSARRANPGSVVGRFAAVVIALLAAALILAPTAPANAVATSVAVANARPAFLLARYYEQAPDADDARCPAEGALDAPPRADRRAFVCLELADANGARDVCANGAAEAALAFPDGRRAPLACTAKGARVALVGAFDGARAPVAAWAADAGGAEARLALASGDTRAALAPR